MPCLIFCIMQSYLYTFLTRTACSSWNLHDFLLCFLQECLSRDQHWLLWKVNNILPWAQYCWQIGVCVRFTTEYLAYIGSSTNSFKALVKTVIEVKCVIFCWKGRGEILFSITLNLPPGSGHTYFYPFCRLLSLSSSSMLLKFTSGNNVL